MYHSPFDNVRTETEIICGGNPRVEKPEIEIPFEKTFRIKVRVDRATAMDRIKLYDRLRKYLEEAGILMCGQTLSVIEITEEEEKEKKFRFEFQKEEINEK